MNKYLALLNDSNLIFSNQEILINASKNIFNGNYGVYNNFMFTEGTGYMKKVYEEIDFVLQSNAGQTYFLSIEEFSEQWGFNDFLSYDILSLSGGWKKFLGLALFTNIKHKNKIYFDSARQLSDRLINVFNKNLKNTYIENVIFFEYDVNLILDDSMLFLFFKENQLIKEIPSNISFKYLDTNYEQFS
jgi:energy-coupling factor transporter ATP-binding protein EcfA2